MPSLTCELAPHGFLLSRSPQTDSGNVSEKCGLSELQIWKLKEVEKSDHKPTFRNRFPRPGLTVLLGLPKSEVMDLINWFTF